MGRDNHFEKCNVINCNCDSIEISKLKVKLMHFQSLDKEGVEEIESLTNKLKKANERNKELEGWMKDLIDEYEDDYMHVDILKYQKLLKGSK